MTRINKLVMHGFKSFARKTELVFGEDFNCIIGPNGSGKSNVLDALTFVLGRRSSKSMRAEKSANLIYNGGKTKQPAKNAEVSIYFDNKKKTFPVDSEEVSVSRIVNDKGNSSFRINGKKSNRNAIIEMLSHAKINPDSYNIILQGDIVKFVEMGVVERRAIIEDIAGIGAYEEKKQRSLRELEKVDQRVNEANIILAERKTHLNELERDRNQALEFKTIDEDIKKYRATYFHVKISQSESENDKLEKKREEYQSKINQTAVSIEDIKSKIKEKKDRIHELNQEIETKGEKEQVNLNRQIEQLKVDIATDKTKIESFEQELQRILARREALENDNMIINKKIDSMEENKKTIERSYVNYKKDLNQIEEEISRFKTKNKFGEDFVIIEKELSSLENDLEKKEVEILKLRQEQQLVMREKDQIEVKIESLNEHLTRASQLEAEHKNQLQELASKRKLLKKTDDDLRKARDEDSSLSAEFSEKRSELEISQSKLDAFEAEQRKITAQSAGDRAVASILELKKEMAGIYGTIAELGLVDEKYSFALERAAGGRIRSIVVDNDKVAQQCIEYLKKNKLGSATFLPLNKMQALSINSDSKNLNALNSKKGAHGFALDLVSFDSKFKNAFAFVFGSTLVVDDLNVARSIGVGSVRMVTLDGDLVESSGAMQGGFFQRKAQGSFAQKNLVKSIETSKERVLALEGSVALIRQKRVNLELKISKLREEKASLEGEVIKLEKSLHLEGGDSDLKTRKQNLSNLIKDADSRLSKIQNEISSHNKELAQIKSKRLELRDKISEMRNPSLIAQLTAFEEKRSEIQQNIVRAETEIKSIGGQIETILGPDVKKSREIIKQNKMEEEKFKSFIVELKGNLKNNNESLKEKEISAQKFMKQFKAIFAERDKLEKEIDSSERKVDDFEVIIKGIEQKLNSLNLDITKLKAELAGLKTAFEPLKSAEIFTSKTDLAELQKMVQKLELKKESMGNVNLRALEVYDEVNKEYEELLSKKTKLNEEKEDVHKLIKEIEENKKLIFMKNFDIVNNIFKDFFSKLTTKGEAYLEIETPENIFEGGIEIKVKLSSKKFMDIKSLSGGEKTLTALAFIFAIQEHDPAYFYILDEVDAALDKHNSEKLAHLIRSYSDRAQYIVISHNDAIISESSRLYGVSMDEFGMSTVTTLEL